ncbi:hypothetical protein [Arthrobacter sp. 35W]|uniref:hypothetical protein n=1 Tax=Arthrobacter sp. 35W TaxID=1132441 RepID=UPI00041CD736|nr:hypothetical protein [Arthrobacter sp. 35W]
MDNPILVNDLLVYSGTLLIGVLIFAVIAVSFLGMLLVALAARGVQMAVVPLAYALRRPWVLSSAALKPPAFDDSSWTAMDRSEA